MWNSLYSFVGALVTRMQREEGQTMAEYGVLLTVIALVVIIAAAVLGNSISSLFNNLAGKI